MFGWHLKPYQPKLILQQQRLVHSTGLIPQANNTKLTRKEREMWNITTKAVWHLGVILVVDVFFHYLYILTIPSDMKLVTKLSDWCLGE